jgi:hypothetical protein
MTESPRRTTGISTTLALCLPENVNTGMILSFCSSLCVALDSNDNERRLEANVGKIAMTSVRAKTITVHHSALANVLLGKMDPERCDRP